VAEIPAKKLKRGRGRKSWPEEFVAKFGPNFTKSGRKRAKDHFLKEFLIKRKKTKFHFISSTKRGIDFIRNWLNFFQNWPNFFKSLAGQQFRDLAKLVLLIIHNSRFTL
jgi:hypothetical protein